MVLLKRNWFFFMALAAVLAAPSTFASQLYINQDEGYSATSPTGWKIVGPGPNREMIFQRGAGCHMVIFPAGRRNQMTPEAYVKMWEPRALKPGTNLEQRTAIKELTINDYPSLLAQYMGKNGPLEIVFMRLPHQILLVLLECPESRDQVMDLYSNFIKSIRVFGKAVPKSPPQAPRPPARSSTENPKPPAQPQGSSAPSNDTTPGFIWE